MKLATLKDSTRDGRLVVVSRDLTRCSEVGHIARTLQAALDDWAHIAPRLARVAEGMETGSQPAIRFHEHDAASPLPRAYQWAVGAAYPHHLELAHRAQGAAMPEGLSADPLMYQGGADSFLAPRAPFLAADESSGIDMEGGIAVVVDDVPMGAGEEEARAAIRLVMLVNGVALRNLGPAGLAESVQSRPPCAFSPVAVTPDELGEAWDGGKLHLPLLVSLNGKPFGRADAGADMTFDFGRLIAHAAKTRPLGAGSIIGSGPVSNRESGPVAAGGKGHSCIAEQRMAETIEAGAVRTPYLAFGDTVRIEMKDKAGHAVFGAIEQVVKPLRKA